MFRSLCKPASARPRRVGSICLFHLCANAVKRAASSAFASEDCGVREVQLYQCYVDNGTQVDHLPRKERVEIRLVPSLLSIVRRSTSLGPAGT